MFSSRPMLLGTALIAYTFGLRHAVDANHISAIDNVTRKLMQEGRRPTAVGLFFSLGHSTIVIALSVAIAFAAATVKQAVPWLQNAGGPIGTLLSALFLFAIAIVNMVVLAGIVRAFKAVRRGERMREEQVLSVIPQAGLLGRLLRPMLPTYVELKLTDIERLFGRRSSVDPEKACPGLDPGWKPVFRQDHARLEVSLAHPQKNELGIVIAPPVNFR